MASDAFTLVQNFDFRSVTSYQTHWDVCRQRNVAAGACPSIIDLEFIFGRTWVVLSWVVFSVKKGRCISRKSSTHVIRCDYTPEQKDWFCHFIQVDTACWKWSCCQYLYFVFSFFRVSVVEYFSCVFLFLFLVYTPVGHSPFLLMFLFILFQLHLSTLALPSCIIAKCFQFDWNSICILCMLESNPFGWFRDAFDASHRLCSLCLKSRSWSYNLSVIPNSTIKSGQYH